MKNKKDIGLFLKEKLDAAQKTPNDDLWGKINDSLNKKEKKKRKVSPIWFLLPIAFSSILGIIFYTVLSNPQGPRIKNTNPIQIDTTHKISQGKGSHSKSNSATEKNIFIKDSLGEITNGFTTINEDNDRRKPKKGNENNDHSPKNRSRLSGNKAEKLIKSISKRKNPNGKIDKTIANVERESGNSTSKGKSKNKISHVKTDSLHKKDLEKRDSTRVAKTQNNKKRIKETTQKDSTKTEQESRGKWAVMVVGGPTYFDISKKYSLIDNSLNGRKTFGEFSFSYGLGVSVPISENLSISFAVLRTKMAYSVKNIPSSTQQDFSRILSYSAISDENLVTEQEFSEFNGTGTSLTLMHEIEYIEMPLQLSYSFVQGKFGVHGFVGFSTLLLQNNVIFAENSRGGRLKLGSANDLLKINLSINAGLGAHYNLSERIRIEINPTFKYHFFISDNQNRNTSGFLLGVYGGIKYNFNLK
ncbi:MAG TPA: hypothetical protein VFM65_08605 [Flavobacteriaceae bacterium]|nr:hypothetical protein [Flavobacteriaceae bacterium]